MINANNIGSHLTKNTATDLAPLVEKIAKKADTNHDGKVSSGEFQEFLASLMKSIDEEQVSTPNATVGTPALPAANASTSAAKAITTIRAIAAAIAKEQ